MNKFDINFFQKYIPEWQELISVIHTHPIQILKWLMVKISLFAILPSFFFYYSKSLQEFVPFYVLESLLIIVFVKVIYDIFDWYNDVWIITNDWVISLERSFLKTNADSISFDNIEWIWVEQEWIFDKLFMKWDLVIHKIWDDSFVLKDAINPFKAVDTLEEISQYEEEEHIEDDKFDMIMDALWWVVWNYLENKDTQKNEKQQKLEEVIEKVEKSKSTIDLR